MDIQERLNKLRSLLAGKGTDALLVTQNENRRYLSGFTGSAGFLVISGHEAILATDFRYIQQAEEQAPGFRIARIKGRLTEWFPGLLAELDITSLGFEARDVSYALYQEVAAAAWEAGSGLSLVPTEGLAESIRAMKDAEEVRSIEQAARIADEALEQVRRTLRPGMSEREVALRLELHMREKGSDTLPYEIIVASGPNSALPHARPTDRSIREGEPVVMDLGARVNGYASDMTRTFCAGKGDSTYNRIYDIVLGAQLTAVAALRAGMTGEQVDRLARTVISQAGYGDNFGHGLGHGIGLAAHEQPRLGPGSLDVLGENMVFTIEPGVYLPGWGGVRIEDTMILEHGGIRSLTAATKDPEVPG
ncbi:MAG: aminopeptidase P family protein [Dehalococcoidia bacterium]|nr:aminopeptidase P family protein [Dehalococcoidia bacterium]